MVADARFKNRGFTLIELMLGILVAGVLLALAVPSFQNLMANNALRTASADLVTAINTARSQAVSLRKDVILKQKIRTGRTAGKWSTTLLWTWKVSSISLPQGRSP